MAAPKSYDTNAFENQKVVPPTSFVCILCERGHSLSFVYILAPMTGGLW